MRTARSIFARYQFNRRIVTFKWSVFGVLATMVAGLLCGYIVLRLRLVSGQRRCQRGLAGNVGGGNVA